MRSRMSTEGAQRSHTWVLCDRQNRYSNLSWWA
jgi:hypothetical protein